MPARLTDRERYLRSIPEDKVQLTLTDALTICGYRWHHEVDSRLSPAGLPDLFAVHPKSGWMVICEVKKERGKLRAAQIEWLLALGFDPAGDAVSLTDYNVKRVVGVARPSSLDTWVEDIRRAALR